MIDHKHDTSYPNQTTMSREIKFRVWIKEWAEDRGEMFNYCFPVGDWDTWMISFDDGKTYDGNFIVGEDIEIMQYTGLKDKNGVEIYEGDILGDTVRQVVEWEEPNSCTCCDQCTGWNVDIHSLTNLEVIGNIYENPELLPQPDDHE